MTKINWDNYPPIPGFDCVKMKREIQAEIMRENEGMTREEIRERERLASERVALRRKTFAERQATENLCVVKKNR